MATATAISSRLREAVPRAAPVAIAGFAFGVSFGVLAVGGGAPAWQPILMSAVVFAGSAQFGALAILDGGGGWLSAAFTGSLLNLRYLAMGLAAGASSRGSRVRRVAEAQLVTDESYAIGVAAGEGGRPEMRLVAGVGAIMWCTWVAGTAVGALVGPALGEPETLGLDAAFPAMFAVLVLPMLRVGGGWRAALAGAAVAWALEPFTSTGVALAGAALAGLAVPR